MQRRAFNGYTNQQPLHGPREREKLKSMVYGGEMVMLERSNSSSDRLFDINDDGELICRDPLAFRFDGAQRIIDAYKNAVAWRGVAWRDNSGTDGKPRPTVLPEQLTNTSQPAALSTINSKMAGRLLAAGGIYNQNPEMFAETARKLGGEAAQGFDEVLNEQTAGSLIALSSIFAAGRAGIHSASSTEIKNWKLFWAGIKETECYSRTLTL